MSDDDDDDDTCETIVVCQGPPICLLSGDVAIKEQQAGCRWCRRITVHSDGTETVIEPGNA